MEFGLGFVSGILATGLVARYRLSMQKKIAALAVVAERKVAAALHSLGAKP